jgi:hypothetical protein
MRPRSGWGRDTRVLRTAVYTGENKRDDEQDSETNGLSARGTRQRQAGGREPRQERGAGGAPAEGATLVIMGSPEQDPKDGGVPRDQSFSPFDKLTATLSLVEGSPSNRWGCSRTGPGSRYQEAKRRSTDLLRI